ncbi:MAG: hypothetical protein K8R68_07730 [Bacteroidales bacterium]|nr:hypothetical protein [Bacteroidales bacterium]
MKYLWKISVLLIGLFWQLISVGQTNASATLDSNSILVGDQVNLNLSFTCPSDYQVRSPSLTDTIISEIEILL